jgi:hypothetical protein
MRKHLQKNEDALITGGKKSPIWQKPKSNLISEKFCQNLFHNLNIEPKQK